MSKNKEIFSKRKTIPAMEVGVTLTISDEALAEIERIRVEQIRQALAIRNLIFR